MSRYSALSLFGHALRGHRHWQPAWRDAQPKARYDIVIIGGGGHGLATAYYLAKLHGVSRVAVLEKGWIGGGNTGRNTTVVRSNYFHPESAAFYDHSLKLYEGLGRDLNYNIMLSQRGMINVASSRHEAELMRRSYNAMQLNGIDCEWLQPDEIHRRAPLLNQKPDAPLRIHAGISQARAGTGLLEMFPAFSRLRLMRQWAGIVDVVKDSTPIMGLTPVPGLFINGGWAPAASRRFRPAATPWRTPWCMTGRIR